MAEAAIEAVAVSLQVTYYDSKRQIFDNKQYEIKPQENIIISDIQV